MACTSVLGCSGQINGNNMDIEDLRINNTQKSELITAKNRIHYEKLVKTMHDWIVKKTEERQRVNIRKDFNKYFANITRLTTKDTGIYINKPLLIYVYRGMIEDKQLETNPVVWSLLQKRPARNISGITNITVLTRGEGLSCKHNCAMCPNEPGMPRSYLKREPAVARGARNDFDAKRQMIDRMNSLYTCGHEIDKLEIIIEGGTYTEYPVDYLREFQRDLIYTANTYFSKKKREPLSIAEEIQINATAQVRIIGICIETRPDAIGKCPDGIPWIRHFREWGVTRVQLGMQSLYDNVLWKIKRGHTTEDSANAIKILKNNGFKVDIHMMPDLPGSTPDMDISMFIKLFTTSTYQPDQVKVYPTQIVPWTKIKQWYEKGQYTPYAETNPEQLIEVVMAVMTMCPPDKRMPRIVRDIPNSYIIAGNKKTNLRQIVDDKMKEEGLECRDIRSREIGRHPEYSFHDSVYTIRTNYANDAWDYFISLESKDKKVIFGFIRLRLPPMKHGALKDYYTDSNFKKDVVFNCLNDTALIRELHVYGENVPVGHKKNAATQHKGVGKRLLQIAEFIAWTCGYSGTAVISGIGVTDYYENKGGYVEEDTFMVKRFKVRYVNMILTSMFLYMQYAFYSIPSNSITKMLLIHTMLAAFGYVCMYLPAWFTLRWRATYNYTKRKIGGHYVPQFD